jgi:site-specific DNA-cytosine methylase
VRYLSLCSGIEAATVAWHPMGWEPAAFAEIEAFPAAVLKHHYPNTPNFGDMTKWREWDVGAIDLLVGGTPCQSFSVAGLRKGLSDPRGGLMLTFLEIAQSLRPRWVVWENVPGVLSSGGGRDFGSFLGALGELGYGWAYRVLDAQWCRVDGYERAVPQRRRRVFVVGCLGDQARAAQVLFERQSVERNPAARGAKRQGVAADAEGGVESGGCYWDGSDCAATLTKQNAGGGQRMPDKANFGAVLQPARAWPAEVWSTLNASFGEKQGLEDQHALGGAPCFVPAATCFAGSSFARYDESQSASTIRRDGGDLGGGSETFVAVPMAVNVSNGEPRVADVMGTLDAARESRGTNQQRFVMEPFRKSHRASSATDDESWVRAETANTLNSFDTGERDTHAVTAIATIDMQACKGNANIGDGSVSPTLCKPSGSDVHAIAIDLYNQAIDGDCAATLTEACGGTNTSGPKVMQVAHTLRAEGHDASEGGTGRGVPLTVAFTCKDHGADAGDVAPTLRAMPHDGSHANGGGQVAVAHGFYSTGGTHGVNMEPEVSPAVKVGSSLGIPSPPAVATHMVVRRLTPVECERLQGFPDDYTNISWRGKAESPDGPRYKALGNSMAVNCMRWIGRRIDAVEKGTELPD